MGAEVSTGQDDHGHRIVVGVDGSPSSEAALRWAVRQAERTGAKVEAVTVWWYPPGYGLAPVSDDEACPVVVVRGSDHVSSRLENPGLPSLGDG